MQYRIWHRDAWTGWKTGPVFEETPAVATWRQHWRLRAESLIRKENLQVNVDDIVELEMKMDEPAEIITYRFKIKPQYIWVNSPFDPNDLP